MVNSITKYTNLTLLQGREFLTKSTGVMAILMASGDKLWSLADVYMKQFRYEHLLHPEDIKNVSQVEWFSRITLNMHHTVGSVRRVIQMVTGWFARLGDH